MTFKELLSASFLHPVEGYSMPQACEVRDVVTTAARANASVLYVACVSAIADGHDAALEAYERGCRHFVAERWLPLPAEATLLLTDSTARVLGPLAETVHGYPARELTVVGITGTHGKTSVALLSAGFLTECGRRVALLTTDGTDIGGTFTPQGALAPDAADLARFFRDAVRSGAEVALVECSAYMLAQGVAEGVPFTAVLGTDFSPRHIGRGEHADMEAYRAAKARLLEMPTAVAVMPAEMTDFSPRGRVFTYSIADESADFGLYVRGERRTGGVDTTVLVLTYQDERYLVETPLIGLPYLHNLAAAMALAIALGEAPKRLATLAPQIRAAGRLDCLHLAGGRTVCFDAAYEAEDLSLVLRVLREHTAGKLSVVLGSVGGRAVARRAPLGAAALAMADFVYFTADDPNGEPVSQIARDMVGENINSARYRVVPSRAEAIRAAALDLRANDVLLILGKPREETQLVNGVKCFFSDRLALFDAIRDI